MLAGNPEEILGAEGEIVKRGASIKVEDAISVLLNYCNVRFRFMILLK
jgi:hypothetical protein